MMGEKTPRRLEHKSELGKRQKILQKKFIQASSCPQFLGFLTHFNDGKISSMNVLECWM
jgi:hypothetical protein